MSELIIDKAYLEKHPEMIVDPDMAGKKFRIWSGEWEAYWKPGSAGYTEHIFKNGKFTAGEYEWEEALAILNGVGPEKKLELREITEDYFRGWIETALYPMGGGGVKIRVKKQDGSRGYSNLILDLARNPQQFFRDLNGAERPLDYYPFYAYLRKNGGLV